MIADCRCFVQNRVFRGHKLYKTGFGLGTNCTKRPVLKEKLQFEKIFRSDTFLALVLSLLVEKGINATLLGGHALSAVKN